MNRNVKTVLEFVQAAQTVLAVYGSPDGPTDPAKCYDILVQLLEDPKLLAAQLDLQDHGVVMILGEPAGTSLVI